MEDRAGRIRRGGHISVKILSIQPFLKGYRLHPVAGGKDKAATEIGIAAVEAGHEIYVLPLPWSGKKVVSELLFKRMPFLADGERIRFELLPTAFMPSGRRLTRGVFRALFREGGWRRPFEAVAGANAFLIGEEWQAVAHAVREVDFDLVHNHQSSSDAPRLLREAGYRKPLVLTNHSAVPSPFLAEYDQVVFVSHFQREQAIAKDPSLAGKSRVIHYFAAPEYCGRLDPQVSTDIVFIGVLDTPRKGLGTILETMAAFEGLRRFRLHVIGEGEMLESHRAYAKEHRLDVVFHGRVPHARNAEIMAGAGLYLMPSRAEGMALTYIEALCMGLPLIGYPPNIREFQEILGREVGLAYDAATGDKSLLRDLILQVLDPSGPFTPEHRRTIAEAARKHFSVARFRANYLDFYRSLK